MDSHYQSCLKGNCGSGYLGRQTQEIETIARLSTIERTLQTLKKANPAQAQKLESEVIAQARGYAQGVGMSPTLQTKRNRK